MKKANNEKYLMAAKRNAVNIVLVVMIVLQVILIVYCFTKKEGFHSDELWSYGYANSYYGGDIYCDQSDKPIHLNEWEDSSVIRDYLVVNKGEEFSYGSVYHNMTDGEHPPLHSLILHTICSFFPDTFSPWYAFSINIVAFVVCMLFLFKTAKLLRGEWFALVCCFLYGFSMGARDTYIYLRMYTLCTALFMVYLYYVLCFLKQYKKSGKIMHHHLLISVIAAFLGFYTHYYMVMLIGIFTFFMCVYLLFKRRIRLMFVYGVSMLGALGMSLVAFPSTVQRIIRWGLEEYGKRTDFRFDIKMRVLMNFVSLKEFSIPISMYKSGNLPIILGYVVFTGIIISPLIFLLRNTKWMRNIRKKIRFVLTHKIMLIKYIFKRVNWLVLVLGVTIIVQLIGVGEASSVYGMGLYEDRYIHYLYPIAVLVGVDVIYCFCCILLKRSRRYKVAVWMITGCILLVNMYIRQDYDTYYFEKDVKGESLQEAVSGETCIYVMNENWFFVAMTEPLMNSKEFFRVSYKDCDEYTEQYMDRIKKGKVLLVVDSSFSNSVKTSIEEVWSPADKENEEEKTDEKIKQYKEIIECFENLELSTDMEMISEQNVFDRKIVTYVINP